MRDDGLITGTERATFRGFLMGHKSMVESAVLVNSSHTGRMLIAGERVAILRMKNMSSFSTADEGIRPWVVVDRCFAACV